MAITTEYALLSSRVYGTANATNRTPVPAGWTEIA